MTTNVTYGGCGHPRSEPLADWLAADRVGEICPSCETARRAAVAATRQCASCGGALGYPYRDWDDRDVCTSCHARLTADRERVRVANAAARAATAQQPSSTCRECGDQLLNAADLRRGVCGECAAEGVMPGNDR